MKYEVRFSWVDEVRVTRIAIIEADNKKHAEELLMEEIGDGMRDEVGKEVSSKYLNDDDQFAILNVEESE